MVEDAEVLLELIPQGGAGVSQRLKGRVCGGWDSPLGLPPVHLMPEALDSTQELLPVLTWPCPPTYQPGA